MPRSLTRPQVGTMVWYYAASPPAAAVSPAIVLAAVATAGTGVGSPPPTFDLFVIDPTAGTGSKIAAVPFHYGTRPASGAWCTMPRVNTPAVGVWPAAAALEDYAFHDLNEEQRANRIEELKEAAEKAAEEAEQAEGNPQHAELEETNAEASHGRGTRARGGGAGGRASHSR